MFILGLLILILMLLYVLLLLLFFVGIDIGPTWLAINIYLLNLLIYFTYALISAYLDIKTLYTKSN
jgi:hypothetical protein